MAGLRAQLTYRLGVASLALASLGLLVRCTIRDRWLVSGWIYYATPPVILLALLLVTVLLVWAIPGYPRRRSRSATTSSFHLPRWVVWLLACVFLGSSWQLRSSLCLNSPAPSKPEDIRFVFWNVYRGTLGWSRVFEELKDIDADVMVLAEATKSADSHVAEELRVQFPSHNFRLLHRGMVILSRLDVHPIASAQDDLGAWERLELKTEADRRVQLLLADLPSDLLLHRDGPIGLVVRESKQVQGPALIAGDFNTPVDSVFLAPLRDQFRSAFEESGTGIHVTWPFPFPALAIDHLWGNSQIEFVNTTLRRSLKSDHCAIVTEFRVTDR